jgi:subfamily B ATP-binding cassette protein MsbA
MNSWFSYLKQGMTRKPKADRLGDEPGVRSAWQNLRYLKPFLLRHWRKGLLGGSLILATSLLALPQPLIYQYLVDKVILAHRLDLLLPVLLVYGALFAIGLVTGPVQSFVFTRFQVEVINDIQSDLFGHTLRLPKSFFDDKETGYLMSRLTGDVGGLSWFFSGSLISIVTSILRFIGGVGLLFYLEWRLALVVMVCLPFMAYGIRYFSDKLRVLGRHGMEQQANIMQRLQETLSASTLVKTFSSEKHETDRFTSALDAARQITLEQTTVGSVANLAIGALPSLARAAVLVAGAYWVIRGDWTFGSLLAFQSYMGYVFGPVGMLASANLQLQGALNSLERVSAIYATVPEEDGQGLPVTKLSGSVEFRNVTFSYDNHDPVLGDVSCLIRPGEHVAIVGPSGVGKTTLVSLLLRFYKPTSGEIWLDGRPAGEYEVRSLRQRFGYVSQSPLLLSGSILENLRYGNPDASQAQVERAAKLAGIHDFIAGLQEGYMSLVGERGVNFSEGQKQRLSIARALVREPDILILDEPTAALDSIVERSILEALPEFARHKTLFIVAHRLATAQHSDRIMVLNEHHLVAVGTHLELLKTCDFYRQLVENQEILLR